MSFLCSSSPPPLPAQLPGSGVSAPGRVGNCSRVGARIAGAAVSHRREAQLASAAREGSWARCQSQGISRLPSMSSYDSRSSFARRKHRVSACNHRHKQTESCLRTRSCRRCTANRRILFLTVVPGWPRSGPQGGAALCAARGWDDGQIAHAQQ